MIHGAEIRGELISDNAAMATTLELRARMIADAGKGQFATASEMREAIYKVALQQLREATGRG
jgi:hypothetical protein